MYCKLIPLRCGRKCCNTGRMLLHCQRH